MQRLDPMSDKLGREKGAKFPIGSPDFDDIITELKLVAFMSDNGSVVSEKRAEDEEEWIL